MPEKKKYGLEDALPEANTLTESESSSEAQVNVDENDTKLEYDDNGRIKVPKKEDREKKWERKTYYLTTEIIETIDEFSKASGHNKSAIVRMALREFFRRAEIQ